MGDQPDSIAVLIGAFVVIFGVTFGAAALGASASLNAGQFYGELNKPPWAPSPAVFGPVWTVLYVLMGISAFLVVWERGWQLALIPLALYLVQLGLNAVWSWLFFAWHRGGAALLGILLLWALVALTAWAFWDVRVLSGVLLLPYLAWVAFATALTWSVWRANPTVL